MTRRSARIAQRLSDAQPPDVSAPHVPPVAPPPAPEPRTFHPFPQLPLELRQMIWKFSLEPRMVELGYHEDRGFFTESSLPSALKVCQESRSTVGKLYTPCFNSLWFPRGTPFNFAKDTLYLPKQIFAEMSRLLSILREREISGLRYLAIDQYEFDIGCDCEECGPTLGGQTNSKHFRTALKGLTGLEEVKVVYTLENSLDYVFDRTGFHWESDPTVDSREMVFFQVPPPKLKPFISKHYLGSCKFFRFLKECKHLSVFGTRKNRMLVSDGHV